MLTLFIAVVLFDTILTIYQGYFYIRVDNARTVKAKQDAVDAVWDEVLRVNRSYHENFEFARDWLQNHAPKEVVDVMAEMSNAVVILHRELVRK